MKEYLAVDSTKHELYVQCLFCKLKSIGWNSAKSGKMQTKFFL